MDQDEVRGVDFTCTSMWAMNPEKSTMAKLYVSSVRGNPRFTMWYGNEKTDKIYVPFDHLTFMYILEVLEKGLLTKNEENEYTFESLTYSRTDAGVRGNDLVLLSTLHFGLDSNGFYVAVSSPNKGPKELIKFYYGEKKFHRSRKKDTGPLSKLAVSNMMLGAEIKRLRLLTDAEVKNFNKVYTYTPGKTMTGNKSEEIHTTRFNNRKTPAENFTGTDFPDIKF